MKEDLKKLIRKFLRRMSLALALAGGLVCLAPVHDAMATIASNLNKHIYDGDGVTVNWPYTFTINSASEMEVYISSAGAAAVKITTGYTVDTANSRVVYPASGSPLTSNDKITLLRVVPLTQLTDWKNTGPFSAETVERAVDKLTMIAQQHDEELARAIKYGVDETPLESELEAASANAAAAAASAAAATSAAATASASSTTAAAYATSASTNATAAAASAALSAQYMPAGAILPYASTTPPSGFYVCDGSTRSRTTDATLFAAIGTTWGAGNGSTTFNLPDLRGKGLYGQAAAGTFSTFASTGGAETHAHTQNAHSHTVDGHTHTISHQHVSPASGASVTIVGNARTDGAGWAYGTSTIGAQQVGELIATGTNPQTVFLNTSDSLTANSGSTSPGTNSQTPTINAGNSLAPFAVINYIIKS
jgi:microcystin-dependent protein